VVLLRRLGYGAAILDFPDIDHSAVGIACPVADSLNGSGYCYAETTNYFPLGVIPRTINGQAQTSNEFTDLFNAAVLGKVEIYQATTGQVYNGVGATKAEVANLKNEQDNLNLQQTAINNAAADISRQETALNNMKAQIDSYYASGQTAQYNSLAATYNNLVDQYNRAVASYEAQISAYNQALASFNQAVNSFYQL
jgi:hypothetical protein